MSHRPSEDTRRHMQHCPRPQTRPCRSENTKDHSAHNAHKSRGTSGSLAANIQKIIAHTRIAFAKRREAGLIHTTYETRASGEYKRPQRHAQRRSQGLVEVSKSHPGIQWVKSVLCLHLHTTRSQRSIKSDIKSCEIREYKRSLRLT